MAESISEFGRYRFGVGAYKLAGVEGRKCPIFGPFGKVRRAFLLNSEMSGQNGHFSGFPRLQSAQFFLKRANNSLVVSAAPQKCRNAHFSGGPSRYDARLSHHIPDPSHPGIYWRVTLSGTAGAFERSILRTGGTHFPPIFQGDPQWVN